MRTPTPFLPPLHIITHEFYPQRGGIATFTEEMARAAAGLGMPVEVWAQAASAHTVEKPWPFHLRRLPLKGSHDLACQIRLARELIRNRRRLRHSTVYLPEPGPMFTLMWLQFCQAFRPRHLLLTFHGSEILKFYHNPLARPLARRLIRHAHRVSTLTHFTQNLLCQRFPEANGKTLITPGALRANFASPDSRSPHPHDRVIILTVARLRPRKGQLLTLQALQALPPELRAKVEYWLVGHDRKGDYEQQLRALAAKSDLRVKFMGDLSDQALDVVYDQADIFAMTSINHGRSIEGFGLVYLEAAAHELPVVAHNVGGVDEAVIHDQTGLLVPPEKPAELTAAFARLINDEALRQQLGQAGSAWARRNSWQQSAELLFGLSSALSQS